MKRFSIWTYVYGTCGLLVWACFYFVYPETLGQVERDSFFVWTPDYLQSQWEQGLSALFRLSVDFVGQFFRWREVGATLLTLGVVIVWWGLSVLWRFLPLLHTRGKRIGELLLWWMLLLVCFSSPTARQRERRIAFEQAATAQDWNWILGHAVDGEIRQDPLLQKYLLLALAEQNRLQPNLSRLSGLTAESFCYTPPKTAEERYFNALLYRSLGIYNEYVHQLFEVGIQSPDGVTFGTLRLCVDGYLKMGNARLAEKYLTLLDRATCHGSWVTSRKRLLAALQADPVETPERSPHDLFVGSYPFRQELELLLNDNPENRVALHYLEALQAISLNSKK
ncbi:MAG: DUF6057 family protein [Parabacteroides sp.]